MKNVIVAGSSGFIGKNLVSNLLARGYKVTCLDIRFDDELEKSTNCVSMKNKTVEEAA